MYSDFRFCRYCSDVGLYTDGENYCTKCESYLCLSCSRTHGQKCERLRHPETRRQSSGKVTSESSSDVSNNKNATRTSPTTQNGSVNNNNSVYGMEIQATKHRKNNADVSKQHTPPGFDDGGKPYGNKANGAFNLNNYVSPSYGTKQNTNFSHFETKHLQPETPHKEQQRPTFSSKMSGSGGPARYSDHGGVIRIMKAWADTDNSQSDRHTMFVCTYHPDMHIGHYCKNHNVVCCDTCVYSTHSQCKVQPIEEVTHRVQDGREIYAMKTKLNELSKTCDNTRLKLLKLQSFSTTDNICTISRPCGGSYIHTMCKSTSVSDKSGGTVRLERTETERVISACDDIQGQISQCEQEIRNAETSENEVNVFIAFHKNKNNIDCIERNLLKIASCAKLTEMNANHALVTDVQYKCPVVSWNVTSKCTNVGSTIDATKSDRNEPARSAEIDDRLGPKSYIIGDVILKPCENPLAYDHDVPRYVYSNSSSSDEEDNQRCVNTERDNLSPVNTKASMCNSRKNVRITKRKETSVHTIPKDKIKIHGLATAFYMNDSNNDVSDDLQILRLHSPEPEHTINLNYCTINDAHTKPSSTNGATDVMCDSNNNDRNRHMIKWQDRKLLESVELRHEKEVNETNRSSLSTKRTKKIFESSESDLKEAMKNETMNKRNKVRQLQTVRRENSQEVPNCTKRNKVKFNRKIKTKNVKYEVETDAIRLKKWIKQTEDMNKAFVRTQTPARTDVHKMDTDGVSDVFSANADNASATDAKQPSFMTIRIKDAKLLKQARVSSATSQASDSDKSRYKRQTFASRPTNTLNLYTEQLVRLPSDKLDCKINGVSCLPDGRIVVSDYNNSSIKLFRVGWSKGTALQLDDMPHDVAVVSNTFVAVIAGLAFDRLIVVSVGQNMAIKRRFKTGCVCKALSSYQSHIYLLCLFRYKTEVRVLNTDGVVSIRYAFGHVIPSPIGIAVNQMNGLMLISDKTEGVFKCESGRVVARSFDGNIGEYHKITSDTSDNVYVSTEGPSGIYEISKDGKHLMPVVQTTAVYGVNAIAYNEALDLFVVCCSEKDSISVYSIHDTGRQVK